MSLTLSYFLLLHYFKQEGSPTILLIIFSLRGVSLFNLCLCFTGWRRGFLFFCLLYRALVVCFKVFFIIWG